MASLSPRNGPLGRRLAAHLLRRSTFGFSRPEVDSLAQLTADQAVEQLAILPMLPPDPADPQTGLPWLPAGHTPANSSNEELMRVIVSWWLYHVLDPDGPLTLSHKLFFFLHTSFVTGFNDIEWNENFYYTLRLFLQYLDGSYKELARKICLDNGMNEFLDIGDSVAGNPNENFVREFFELFTIGKGPGAGPDDYTTFTELDVIEAARLMTGFRLNNDWDDPLLLDPDTQLPRANPDVNKHDTTDKQFSPRFQDQVIAGRSTAVGMLQEVDEFVEMIFAQPATAEQIVRRMYRFFVRYDVSPEVETDIIQPLATSLMADNYTFLPVLKTLLKSEHFYDADDADATDNVVGALIKSPLELQLQVIKYFQIPLPDPADDLFEAYISFGYWGIQKVQSAACFDLFEPPEVAGYQPIYQAPEYNRLWISAKSIPARYAIADEHLDGPMILQMDVMAWIQDVLNITEFSGNDFLGNPGPHPGARIAPHLVQEMVDYLLPEALPQVRFDYFLEEVLLDGLTALNWQTEWDAFLSSGDDANIKPQIKRLLKALLQSPEFQLG